MESGKELVKALVVEEGIEWIPERMFQNYPLLSTVALPGLRDIDPYAFRGCDFLESVTIGGSVEKIGKDAFEDCSFLHTFIVNGTVGSIGDGAFKLTDKNGYYLSSFDTLITGDIGAAAFSGRDMFLSISPIRGSVGEGVFLNTYLASYGAILIVSGHSGILGDAFGYSSKPAEAFAKIYYTGTKEEFEARYVNNSCISSKNISFQWLGKDVSWELSNGVLSITGSGATIDLLEFTEQPWLNIPGRTGDENREQITKVVVQAGIQLGEHMLDLLEDRVEYLHDHAGTLGDLAWTIDAGTLSVSGNGAIPNMDGQDDTAWMPYRKEIREIILEDGVTAVGFGAFAKCPELTTVSFPDSVTRIDGGAFYECPKLDNVSLPENLQTLSRNVFTGCAGLRQIYIPKSVKEIGSQAFQRTSLKDIYYGGTMDAWNALNVGDVSGATVHPSSYGLSPMDGEGSVGPKTGDTGRMRLWIALMCLSGAAMVSMMIFGDKRKAKSR